MVLKGIHPQVKHPRVMANEGLLLCTYIVPALHFLWKKEQHI